MICSHWLGSRPTTDPLRRDDKNHAHLIVPAIPGIGFAEVFLREHLDMLDGAVGGDRHHAAADLHVARGAVRRGDGYGHAWVARNVLDLYMRLHDVDQHVLAVRINPGLGDLRRTIRHRAREIADTRLAQQGEHLICQFHIGSLSFLMLGSKADTIALVQCLRHETHIRITVFGMFLDPDAIIYDGRWTEIPYQVTSMDVGGASGTRCTLCCSIA